jgi:uncharacterized protein YyaL (SSP411 family)
MVFSNQFHIDEAIKWLSKAQDSTADDGVSEGYHLYHGWLPSYPETTGYIIETFFDYYHLTGDERARTRAIRMADWLVSVQNDDGSISDSYFKRKMVFDTGQVIFGLVRCHQETGSSKYLVSAEKAGRWLLRVQEKDGTWRRYAVDEIPHTYYSRVAWSLLKLHSMIGDRYCIDAAEKNIAWAIKQQNKDGWFNHASFNLKNHKRPFTHTIAYTMRGILEAGLYLKKDLYTDAVKKALDNFLGALPSEGRIPGTYGEKWEGDFSFSCLTGNAQLAIVLLRLFEIIKDQKYWDAANRINHYLKAKQELRIKDDNVYGAIPGSSPIWGKYIHFAYPNWAAKFFIDALILESKISRE